PWRIVKTSAGIDYRALAVIIATGSTPLLTGVPGENKFLGRGVSTCATCDAFFYRNKDVVVVGGGDAAVEEAIFLTKFASQVFIIHRRDSLRAQKILQERALANPKIIFVWNSVLVSINGEEKVKSVTVKNVNTQETREINCEGVFIYIGRKTNTEFLQGIVPLDEKGAIIVNLQMETGIPGIFAAGEVRSKSCRQAIASAGDGACAAIFADHYLQKIKPS
ncbi:MAG: FAD-dependent oxidoreductase, partial [Candidatus Sumerlaeia bacterium]|nr:FAD-dependent oxidoreductase [Candidatus Sumerlaeia bacterium]